MSGKRIRYNREIMRQVVPVEDGIGNAAANDECHVDEQ